MPLWMPNGATGFQGTLAIASGGTGGATAKDAQRLMSGVYTVAQSAVQVVLTGTGSRTTMATITIPANSMGANGRIRVNALFTYTNSANNKTLGIRFGGAGGTLMHNFTATTTAIYKAQIEFANRNATNSQVSMTTGISGGFGTSAGSLVTAALDTTANQDIVIEGTLGLSTETINLESFSVELFSGAGS